MDVLAQAGPIESTPSIILSPELIRTIREQYALDWRGIHGISHWCRVYENGMLLAKQEGVARGVVQLFSVFHDAGRRSEGYDENHGPRGAELARQLRALCPVNDREFLLLVTACSEHTRARCHDDLTVRACFDADRLDLGRVGNKPDPRFLCTPLAKRQETIEWAWRQSMANQLPDNPLGLLTPDL